MLQPFFVFMFANVARKTLNRRKNGRVSVDTGEKIDLQKSCTVFLAQVQKQTKTSNFSKIPLITCILN